MEYLFNAISNLLIKERKAIGSGFTVMKISLIVIGTKTGQIAQ